MKTIKGVVQNDLRIDEPCAVNAVVNGNIEVTSTGVLSFKGICNGRITVEPGGNVEIAGVVNGGVHYLAAPATVGPRFCSQCGAPSHP